MLHHHEHTKLYHESHIEMPYPNRAWFIAGELDMCENISAEVSVKLSQGLIKCHTMNTYGGVEV
jgi:hypothetical protein